MGAKPVVKWAGGKRQLVYKLIEYMPKEFKHYYEPFVGGGALLFELLPKKATINDVNDDLICIYRSLANEEYYHLMLNELDKHEFNHSEEYYYKVRMMDREPNYKSLPIWVRAARTIYLNKSCFNGLYRVNSKGYFNVPFGKKEKINTYDKDNMEIIHYYFKTNDVTILNGDFAKAVENAKAGDFVYFDPPYDPLENKNSFTSYSKDNFTRDDQERLANLFMELSKKGVYVMLSNHNTSLIKELYKDYNIRIVHAKRVINSDSNGRGDVEEVIVTNY